MTCPEIRGHAYVNHCIKTKKKIAWQQVQDSNIILKFLIDMHMFPTDQLISDLEMWLAI